MPKITELPAETTPSNNDPLAIVDTSGAITKQITRENLFKGTPLPSNTVDDQSVSGVSAIKITNPYKFRVYLNAAQNTSGGSNVRIAYDTRNYDTNSNIDITTNKGRFTAPLAGVYKFSAAFQANIAGSTQIGISFFKNGVLVSTGQTISTTAASASSNTTLVGTDDLQLALNDYIEVMAFCNGSIPIVTGSTVTYFSGSFVSN